MLRIAPIKLCGLLLLCVACFTTVVMAFSLFGSGSAKKNNVVDEEDHRLMKRHYGGGRRGGGKEYIIGGYEIDGEYTDDEEAQQEEDEEDEGYGYERNDHGKIYSDEHRITTEYTTVTGSCIPADGGQNYYSQYNAMQQYFQMGIYGNGRAASVASPFSVGTTPPACDDDPEWAKIRDHWNAIFFGDYTVGGYQQTLGPLAVQGDFIGHDYVLSTNHQFQCSSDVKLDNTAFVVGGTVTGQVVISRGMSYVGNVAGSNSVSGSCPPAQQGTGPVDWAAYYLYWTGLSEALSQLMPTHFIDNNNKMNAITPGSTNSINVFTFNTCNEFNCPLWPGFLSTPDNIFSGYGTWDGPAGGYPSSGTLLFNIPVDDGTTFHIDSIHPSINADYCRTIYNVYPADAQGNYLPNGHITIRRNTVDMIRGLFLAPLADIEDGPTGRFGGMVVGNSYSWQQTNGVEIDDWGAAANGAYYCTKATGCIIPPTPTDDPIIPTPTPTDSEAPSPTDTDRPSILTPDETTTVTDCQTTVSQCTATACTETETLTPDTVTMTTTGDCEMTPPVTITNTDTVTNFVVSTETDCTSTATVSNNIVGPTRTVTQTISTCPPGPDPDCTLTDEFCLDTITTTEPAFCTDYTTVTTTTMCTETEFNPNPDMCTETATECRPTHSLLPKPETVTHTETQTVTYIPGCDDYRYPQCDYNIGQGWDDDNDGDDDWEDGWKHKKHGKKHHRHKKNNRWNKKKKMQHEN
ncbi:hypothetical protein BCR42DRAFT_468130 [Absidia repens]|uniref:Choice-of-anchor A domain-containing protein n=1 Tax=Absidia repens TaxID=90262 RepID=A0A1X2I9S9_9FUNG|nr:hypothetical protein BCR42DRAFT_468130 [Absidia repens]